jgi:polysaccharide pyruvyl transferase CsaB
MRDNTQKLRVGISGSYGGFNVGDEAILSTMIEGLRSAFPVELTVFSRDADDTRRRHGVEHAVQLGTLSRGEAQEVVAELELFILGGGGILYDGDAEMFLREVTLAKEVGTPVMIYAVGAGPLVDSRARARVRDAVQHVAAVTVRDAASRHLLEELGVRREIVVTADPALLLKAEPLRLADVLCAEAIDPEATLIGFSVREPGPAAPDLKVEQYHRLLADAADYMIERFNAQAVFVPLERRTYDHQHSHTVVGQMSHAQRATVLKGDYSPGQVVSLLEHFEFSVGMRLHFLIFSALAGRPFMALPYASKVAGFLDDLELQTPAWEEVSTGRLLADLDRAWHRRDELKARIRSALKELQARAHVNNEITVRLLTEMAAPRNRA